MDKTDLTEAKAIALMLAHSMIGVGAGGQWPAGGVQAGLYAAKLDWCAAGAVAIFRLFVGGPAVITSSFEAVG